MKKLFIKILSFAICLSVMATSLFACSSVGNWTPTKMFSANTQVKSHGGFFAETDDYFYYLNGLATSTANNEYGKPIKGTLVVSDKSFNQTEIAVPKLFASTDYSAGIYIFGDYVYYGTPSTDRTPEGTVANSEMEFRKAKLDGSSDEELLKVNALTTEYRFVEKDGVVYIVYYDATEKALISYNTSSKNSLTIAKTDEKTAGYQSLNKYCFLDNGATGKAVVLYTTTVYQLPYNDQMIEGTGQARVTEDYNQLYAYSVGDVLETGAEMVGTVIYDGESEYETFEIVKTDAKFVYFKKTNAITKKVATYALTIEELMAKQSGVEIREEYLTDKSLVISLDEVYFTETIKENEGTQEERVVAIKLYKDKLTKTQASNPPASPTRELIAVETTLDKLLLVHGDYIYYYNTDSQIYRIKKVQDENANPERVSEGTVSTTWYQPEIAKVTIGTEQKDCLFYCDNSTEGMSYVKYVDISASAVGEDTNEDGKNDFFYLEGHKYAGKIRDEDSADMMEYKINRLSEELDNGVLIFDTDDEGNYVGDGQNQLKVQAVLDVRAEYDALKKSIKDKVQSSAVEKLEKYERAIEIANLFYQIEGVKDIETYDESNSAHQQLKQAYQAIKATIEKYYSSGEYTSIGGFIHNNLKAHYEKAIELFEPNN